MTTTNPPESDLKKSDRGIFYETFLELGILIEEADNKLDEYGEPETSHVRKNLREVLDFIRKIKGGK